MNRLNTAIFVAVIALVAGCGATQQKGSGGLEPRLKSCSKQNVYDCATQLVCAHDFGPPDTPVLRFKDFENIAGTDVTAVIEQDGKAREVHFRSASSDSTTELVVESCG